MKYVHFLVIIANFPVMGEVVRLGTDYFMLEIKFLVTGKPDLPQNTQSSQTAVSSCR